MPTFKGDHAERDPELEGYFSIHVGDAREWIPILLRDQYCEHKYAYIYTIKTSELARTRTPFYTFGDDYHISNRTNTPSNNFIEFYVLCRYTLKFRKYNFTDLKDVKEAPDEFGDSGWGMKESVFSSDEIAAMVKKSPNIANNTRLDGEAWERFRNRFGYGPEDGPFVSGIASVEVLIDNMKKGYLRVSPSTDQNEIDSKVKSGKFNTVIITAEQGRGMLVVDGNHSLRAAILRGDETIPVIVDQKYASILID